MADRIQENRIKEDKNILLHYLKVEVLLLDYENIIKTFHKITRLEEKTYHMEICLKSSMVTIGIKKQRKLRNKIFKITGIKHLVNLKVFTESQCDRCYFSMCVMSKESW